MPERHEAGRPKEVAKEERKEKSSEYALCLYSDFSVPEPGESKPLGRILDQEIHISCEPDPDWGNRLVYWIGSGDTGWQSLRQAEARKIWEVFERLAKDKLYEDVMNNRGGSEGTGYWWQKYINEREPGSDEWKELSGNPPSVSSPDKS
jgi:hypothetical protein